MIVHLVGGFYNGGAVAARARQEAQWLQDAGLPAMIVTNKFRNSQPEPSDDAPSVQIHSLPCSYIPGPLFTVTSDISFNRQIKRFLHALHQKSPVQTVVAHGGALMLAASKFAAACGAVSVYVTQALIWDRLENDANPYGRILTRWFLHCDQYALTHSNYILSISEAMSRGAIEHGARRDSITLLPNAVDTNRFYPGADVKEIDILFIGRYSEEKGLAVLIAALRAIPRRLRVSMAGAGGLEAWLKAEVATLHHEVTLLGRVKNEDLPGIIRRAKVQVVPSLSEPQGVVVLEAMACGVAPVASNVGGIPDMITDGVEGWLVAPRNAPALAQALDDALTNDDERQRRGVAALKKVQAFNFSAIREKTLAFYRSLGDNMR